MPTRAPTASGAPQTPALTPCRLRPVRAANCRFANALCGAARASAPPSATPSPASAMPPASSNSHDARNTADATVSAKTQEPQMHSPLAVSYRIGVSRARSPPAPIHINLAEYVGHERIAGGRRHEQPAGPQAPWQSGAASLSQKWPQPGVATEHNRAARKLFRSP